VNNPSGIVTRQPEQIQGFIYRFSLHYRFIDLNSNHLSEREDIGEHHKSERLRDPKLKPVSLQKGLNALTRFV